MSRRILSLRIRSILFVEARQRGASVRAAAAYAGLETAVIYGWRRGNNMSRSPVTPGAKAGYRAKQAVVAAMPPLTASTDSQTGGSGDLGGDRTVSGMRERLASATTVRPGNVEESVRAFGSRDRWDRKG